MNAHSLECPCCIRNERDRIAIFRLDKRVWQFAKKMLEEANAAALEIFWDCRDAYAKRRGKGWRQRELLSMLREFVERFSNQTGVSVNVNVSPSWKEEALLPEARVQLFRMFQEAFTNVRKHASASEVHVELSMESGHAHIHIEDNGRGFLLSRHLRRLFHPTFPRRGLCRMRDRVRKIGGTFRIKSYQGKGTSIGVDIPLNRWTQAMWL